MNDELFEEYVNNFTEPLIIIDYDYIRMVWASLCDETDQLSAACLRLAEILDNLQVDDDEQ